MKKPNFLIVGAAKSGTTSLYYYLQQHPSIYLSPVKETNFFATNFVDGKPTLTNLDFNLEQAQKISFSTRDWESYLQLFAESSIAAKAIGEVSPLYLNSSIAAQKIKSFLPDVKLIAILRNPIDRAYSGYQMQLRQTDESRNFSTSINQDEIYIRGGFYYSKLKRYFNVFERHQIKILLYEDFKADPLQIMQDIFKFLQVDTAFVPEISQQFNQGGIPKNKSIYNFLYNSQLSLVTWKTIKSFMPLEMRRQLFYNLRRKLLSKPEPISPEIRESLKNIYRQDIQNLEKLLNLNLQQWLS